MSGYTIGGVFNQLTLDNLGQCHLVDNSLRKMILAKTQYEIHKSKLLAIIKAFKICRHYLKDYKHKILVFIYHNNL